MEGYNNIIMIILGKNGQKMGCLVTKNDKNIQRPQQQDKPFKNRFRLFSKDSEKNGKTSSTGKLRVLGFRDIKKQKLCLRTNENMNSSKLCFIEQKKTLGSIRSIKNQDFVTDDFFLKDLKQISIEIAKQARQYLRSEDLLNKQYTLQELIHSKMKSRFPKTIQCFDRLKTFSKIDDIKVPFQQQNEQEQPKKEVKNYTIQQQFDLTLKLETSTQKNQKGSKNKLLDTDQNQSLKSSLGIQADIQRETMEQISRTNILVKQLQSKSRDFIQKLQVQQKELSQLQNKLRETKEANNFYLNQISSNSQYLTFIQQQKRKISIFLQTQPNKILQMEAQGYKECEQQLFNLAEILENSNYDGMLNSIYQQIDVPQSSFYYMIDHCDLNLSDSDALTVHKQKLKSVYHKIKLSVQSILRLKAQKIESFVTTLRKLASYTIGKRQYLEEIKKKVIYLSGNIQMSLKMLEIRWRKSLGDEPSKQLSTISDAFHNFREAFKSAQVFY